MNSGDKKIKQKTINILIIIRLIMDIKLNAMFLC